MATNIGTQAAALIDQAHNITWAMEGLSKIGTCLTTGEEAESFINLVHFLAEIQTERIDALTSYIAREVLPLVADIEESPEA